MYTSVTDPNDAVLCGYFATGDRRDIASLTSWLWYDDETTWYLVAPKTCLRVACWNTSGIYVGSLFPIHRLLETIVPTSANTLQVCNVSHISRCILSRLSPLALENCCSPVIPGRDIYIG